MRAQTLRDDLPEPELIVTLPPEELAGQLLRALGNQRERPALYKIIRAFTKPPLYPPDQLDQVCKATAEAWNWMLAQGVLADSGADNGDPHEVFITRKGKQLSERGAFEDYKKASLLPRVILHAKIAEKAWPTYVRGDYETAVFQAFKEVEIAVRDLCNFEPHIVGTDLMRRAFDPKVGPLSDEVQPAAEREALAHLFAGAIGSYKNPVSHRTIVLSEAAEGGEILILASHLLRIVEDRAARPTRLSAQ